MAPLPSHFKLCASRCGHLWIQTGVTARKILNWDKIVLTSVILTFDIGHWPSAWASLLSMVITPKIEWWLMKRTLWKSCDKQTNSTIHRATGSQLQIHTHITMIMSAMASQIIGVCIVCSTVGSVADQRKHQSSAPLAFVQGIHRWLVNSPRKRPVTRKILPFDDVIMMWFTWSCSS